MSGIQNYEEFNIFKARMAGQLSDYVYRDSHEDFSSICQNFVYPNDSVSMFLEFDGCQVFCIRNLSTREIVFVFRGTDFESWNDTLVNLQINLDFDMNNKCRVHRGFRNELNSVWQTLQTFLPQTELQTYTVTCTGHSLGGALALLCASRIAYYYDVQTVCYSFGSPEIGDQSFYNFFQELPCTHWRIRHNNDKVPEIHTLSLMGYRHVGFEIHITYNGRFVYQDLSWQDRLWDWMAGHWNAFRNWKFGDSIQDHSIESYVQHLQREERRHPEFENKSNNSRLGLIWVDT